MDSEETTGQYSEQVSQRFDFELSRTDYERVFRWVLIWRHKWKRVVYPVILLMGVVLLVELEMMRRYSMDVPWFVYLGLFMTFGFPVYALWCVPFLAARAIFRSLNSTQMTCVISESGVDSSGQHSTSHIGWPDVRALEELKDYFVFSLQGRSFAILPKRAVAQELQQQLRNLVASCLAGSRVSKPR